MAANVRVSGESVHTCGIATREKDRKLVGTHLLAQLWKVIEAVDAPATGLPPRLHDPDVVRTIDVPLSDPRPQC